MGSVHGSFFLLTAPDRKEESSEQPLLGDLTVTGVTPDSLHLSWTVAQGPFDSFVIQYKDAQGQPQTVPVAGDENEVTVPGLESNRKYKMNLYGLRGRQRVGPVSVVAKTGESEPTLLAPGPRQGLPPAPPSISAVLLLRPLPPSSQPLFCPHIPSQDSLPRLRLLTPLPEFTFPILNSQTLSSRPFSFSHGLQLLLLDAFSPDSVPGRHCWAPALGSSTLTTWLLCAGVADPGGQGTMLLQPLSTRKGVFLASTPQLLVRLAPSLICLSCSSTSPAPPVRW